MACKARGRDHQLASEGDRLDEEGPGGQSGAFVVLKKPRISTRRRGQRSIECIATSTAALTTASIKAKPDSEEVKRALAIGRFIGR